MDEINEEKLKKMLARIIKLEQENANTKDYNDNQMVMKIKKIIEEEEKCF